MRLFALLLALAICSTPGLRAQSVVLYDLDTTGFPVMRGSIMALDASGSEATPAEADLVLREEGRARPLGITCPDDTSHLPLSSLLLFGTSDKGLITAAGEAWTELLDLPHSEAAIAYFYPGGAIVTRSFTSERDSLVAAARQPTPYESMLNRDLGVRRAIEAVGEREGKKVLVIVSNDVTFPETSVTEAVRLADLYDCVVNAVAVGWATEDLRRLCRETGGELFIVDSSGDVPEALRLIHAMMARTRPCTLTWTSGPLCPVFEREVEIGWMGATATTAYEVPERGIARITFDPPVAVVRRGAASDTLLTISYRALADSFVIGAISAADPSIILSASKMSLAPGEQGELTIAIPSGFTGRTSISLETDRCAWQLPLTVIDAAGPSGDRIAIILPSGGERLVAGRDTTITWEGGATPVTLRYSPDGGATWRTIAENVTGGSFRWPVPEETTSTALIAVVPTDDAATMASWGSDRGSTVVAWNPAGSALATSGTGAVWGYPGGDRLFSTSIPVPADLAWSPTGDRLAWVHSYRDAPISISQFPSGETAERSPSSGRVGVIDWTANGGGMMATGDVGNWSGGDHRAWYYVGHIIAAETLVGLRDLFPATTAPLEDVAFSPDGSLVAALFGRALRIWDPATAGLDRRGARLLVTRDTASGLRLDWSPDGSWIATGESSALRIWDGRTGRLTRTLSTDATSLGWSPDGTTIALGSSDGSVTLRDAATLESLRSVTVADAPIRDLAWSPDGRHLAIVGDFPTIYVWSRSMTGIADTSDAPFAIVGTGGTERPSANDAPAITGLAGHPSDGSLTVRFTTADVDLARLTLFNTTGEEVARLFEGSLTRGDHEVTTEIGRLASGAYFLLLETSAGSANRRTFIVR